VRSLPPERIRAIHLAGGRRIERGRVLDDHLHGVPDEVFALLGCVTAPTVILERDGNYPPIEELLAELDRARSCPLSPLRGERVRVRGESRVTVAPHPGPLPAKRGEGEKRRYA
jgi:hypothetical protein